MQSFYKHPIFYGWFYYDLFVFTKILYNFFKRKYNIYCFITPNFVY